MIVDGSIILFSVYVVCANNFLKCVPSLPILQKNVRTTFHHDDLDDMLKHDGLQKRKENISNMYYRYIFIRMYISDH